MSHLRYSPLLMIWRRALDLSATRRSVLRLNGWPEVGEDSYSVMYDAGNALVGYWNQADLFARPKPVDGLKLEAGVCSLKVQEKRGTAFNPSNQLTLAVNDIHLLMKRVGSLAGHPVKPAVHKGRTGRSISVIDDLGNTTQYVQFGNGMVKPKLEPPGAAGIVKDNGFQPAVGYDLIVSDLAASRRFYAETLGIREIESARGEVVFDTGSLLLTLKEESSVGMIGVIGKTGKLRDDLVSFHTQDAETTVDELTAAGIVFPLGIEDSGAGRLAIFEDPDGHRLSVWQPPVRTGSGIDYFEVLDRLLVNAAAQID